tara:strand:+ start:290 stop:970 length:681 start_codon:yes stop_codon:yes gene_type:complete
MSKLHYKVCAPRGASGHFLGHFLHPEFKANTSDIRVDSLTENNPIYSYIKSNNDGHTHDMDYTSSNEKVLRILTPTRSEKIKAVFNIFYKNHLVNNFILATIVNKFFVNLLNIADTEYNQSDINDTISVNYKDIFNLLYLSELYYNVNNTICPDYKIEYAHSYISSHIDLYNNWSYKALEKIFNFEYDNNLIESVSGKMRNWSIDEIDENNWQTFLKEKLCLTNYH